MWTGNQAIRCLFIYAVNGRIVGHTIPHSGVPNVNLACAPECAQLAVCTSTSRKLRMNPQCTRCLERAPPSPPLAPTPAHSMWSWATWQEVWRVLCLEHWQESDPWSTNVGPEVGNARVWENDRSHEFSCWQFSPFSWSVTPGRRTLFRRSWDLKSQHEWCYIPDTYLQRQADSSRFLLLFVPNGLDHPDPSRLFLPN
jgi:hypothetical protein